MKRIKFEYLIAVLAMLFLAFTLGYYIGRNGNGASGESAAVLQTEYAPAVTVQSSSAEKEEIEIPNEETALSAEETETEFPININTADAAELQALPGIGTVLAEAIISHRETFGDFETPEDIMLVTGIGEKRFEAIQSFITTEATE